MTPLPVAVDQLVGSASACDIGLEPLVPGYKNTQFPLPNKFFEYLMAGLGLVSSDLAELAAVTRQFDVNVLMEPASPAKLTERLNELLWDGNRLKAFQRRAYEAAKTTFHWELVRRDFLA